MNRLRHSVPSSTGSVPPAHGPDVLTIIAAILIIGLGAFFLALGMTTFRLSDTHESPICPTSIPCQTRAPGAR